MADAPIGVIPAPEAPAASDQPVEKFAAIRAQKSAKMDAVKAGLAKLASEQPSAPAEPKEAPKGDPKPAPAPEKPAEDQAEPKVEEVEAKPDPKADAKPEAKADEDVDPKTAKGLAAIDKQAKKFREEQAAARKSFESEMAQARADFARERAELTQQMTQLGDLRQLAKRDPISLLRKLGIEHEDEWETIGRGAFPFTKQGKADPRSAQLAQQAIRERERDDDIATVRKQNEALLERLEAMEKRSQAEKYVEEYGTGLVKSIPTEPTLISKLHAKSPAKARQALLDIAVRLERDNDGETPDHADVIAEYERTRRAELEEQGVDVDALLKPPVAEKPKAPAPRSPLDIEATKGTKAINGTPSRAERLAALEVDLKRKHAEQP